MTIKSLIKWLFNSPVYGTHKLTTIMSTMQMDDDCLKKIYLNCGLIYSCHVQDVPED